jgi:hypothetical protein
MKKRITKIWGVGLTLVLMASLLVVTPASAVDPLQWNPEVIPSDTGYVLAPGLDILDISVHPDGETIYAVGVYWGQEGLSATVTTSFSANDTAAEVFAFTYVNQDGVGSRTGSISFADNATADTAGTVTLQTGDTGVHDVSAISVTSSNAASGAFNISGTTSGTVLGTWTITGSGAGTYADAGTLLGDLSRIYKSTNGGNTWTDLSSATGLAITTTQYVHAHRIIQSF